MADSQDPGLVMIPVPDHAPQEERWEYIRTQGEGVTPIVDAFVRELLTSSPSSVERLRTEMFTGATFPKMNSAARQAFDAGFEAGKRTNGVERLRPLIERYRGELKRISAINTAEDRPQVVPSLLLFQLLNELEALLSAPSQLTGVCYCRKNPCICFRHDAQCESELTSHGHTPCRCEERANGLLSAPSSAIPETKE